ncbi:MAG: MBL fold metallo-hydrolase [Actinobacteria bacterium]|nr:MBL fold metallo-hydrolase [Actinomycetota bacterium]
MLFRQLIHDDLGCASYLIGDRAAGVAAVVDPRFEVDEYLELARYYSVSIEHILETHNHADHVSGHGRLVAATGARIHIHRDAGVEYEHEPLDDGQEIHLGTLLIRAIHTPGHRPEHMAFALVDTSRGGEPWALLTGDTLFVNDIARPDLAIERSAGARGIYRSLQERLLVLPATVEIWPGHIGGSLCGGSGMDMKTSSTIGYERAHNPQLTVADEDRFVEALLATLGPQPPNLRHIVELNRGPLRDVAPESSLLTPGEVEARRLRGALIADLRTEREFAAAHLPGSLCTPLAQPGFGSRLAWLAGADQEIVFIGDEEDACRAAGLAGAVGLHRVGGHLEGGLAAWQAEGRPTRSLRRIAIAELAELSGEDAGLQILDVRDAVEFRAGHIPRSVHLPWREITEVPAGLDPRRSIAVVCGSGSRSAIGASLLQHHGAAAVLQVVDGGVRDWGRLGLELATEPQP